MRSISQWQKHLKDAADVKFPDNTLGNFDRIASLLRQIDDLKCAIAVEKGELESDHHAHQDPNHRIAALIADALIFAEERGADVEYELEIALVWFRNNS